MIPRPPSSTRTGSLFPYTTLSRSPELSDRNIVVRPMLAAHRGPHRLFHIGKLRLLQVGKVGLEQQVAAASQVETQIDLHLRDGRQLVEDLVGQEARDGAEVAEQPDDADADGFPARESEQVESGREWCGERE